MEAYIAIAMAFAYFAKMRHHCRTLDEARTYVGEYPLYRMALGKSAWTVRLDAAALAKLYGCGMHDFGVPLPPRRRADIIRNRGDIDIGALLASRHGDLVAFVYATGLRRHELKAVRPEDVEVRSDGTVIVQVRQGKGGKSRFVVALDDTPQRLAEQAGQRGGSLSSIPSHAMYLVRHCNACSHSVCTARLPAIRQS